jgi:hypothetical protein
MFNRDGPTISEESVLSVKSASRFKKKKKYLKNVLTRLSRLYRTRLTMYISCDPKETTME